MPLDIEKKRLWQSKESNIVALQIDICADIGGISSLVYNSFIG
jgi:hypothetical protein